MDQLLSVWTKAREIIRTQMTALSFKAWIDVIEPLNLVNDILVLQVPDKEISKTLTDFYFDLIMDSVKKTNPSINNVLFVLPEDREKYIQKEETYAAPDITLNSKYTFESFVVGSSNQFCHAAALSVAETPGFSYNPLFIYGGVGLGKTHLMHAIGHYVKKNNPSMVITYVTSETFTNELINAIQEDKRMEFRKKYRNVDLLMIDDVQFISKSQATQEEFFNTFNTLYNANKQIVISSDRPPKEIPKLEERLCSRFAWGLVADIQPPDIETRIAILRNRAAQDNIYVSDDIINFIAEHVHSNIRELEGCLTKVIAYSKLKREELSLATTQEALRDMIPDVKKKEITPELIKQTVSEYYSIPVEWMNSQRKDKQIALPRQIAMYLCYQLLGLPHKKIVACFNRVDHTTSMHANDKISAMIEEDENFKMKINDIIERMK